MLGFVSKYEIKSGWVFCHLIGHSRNPRLYCLSVVGLSAMVVMRSLESVFLSAGSAISFNFTGKRKQWRSN